MPKLETKNHDEVKRMYFRARPEVRRGLRMVSAAQGIHIEVLLDRIICDALPSLGGPRITPRQLNQSA